MTNLEIFWNSQTRRVSKNRDVGLILEGEIKCWRCTKTITCCANSRDALLLQRNDDIIHDTIPGLGTMCCEPLHSVKSRVIEVDDGIVVENVGYDRFEPVAREIVCEELKNGS